MTPDIHSILSDLTLKQTELLNSNAPECERVAVFQEIQKVQEQRRKQER